MNTQATTNNAPLHELEDLLLEFKKANLAFEEDSIRQLRTLDERANEIEDSLEEIDEDIAIVAESLQSGE
jgi:hypothetical protein